jgi:release factor glutamine methyltransferase
VNAAVTDSYAKFLADLESGFQQLPDKPEETASATLSALAQLAAGRQLSVVAAAAESLPTLNEAQQRHLGSLITQRLSGVPLAHLTERQRFMGLELLAGPDALIPRHETELLAGAAVARAKDVASRQSSVLAIDVCTGSGNVALAVAHHVPGARVFAADLSESAVALARRNAELLGLTARVTLAAGDLLAPFDNAEFHGKVDVLSCNPPYISTGKLETMPTEIIGFEPSLAFDGGPLGIRIIQRLITEAPRFLRSGGWLCFEVGLGQGNPVRNRVIKSGHFEDVETVNDSQGEPRAIVARRK